MDTNSENHKEENHHWGMGFLVAILVLIMGIQAYMLHEMRQRMDKIEGKSAAHPVASQMEPRSVKEEKVSTSTTATENKAEAKQEAASAITESKLSEQSQQAGQQAQQTTPVTPAEQAAKTNVAPEPVKPIFPVEVTQATPPPAAESSPATPTSSPTEILAQEQKNAEMEPVKIPLKEMGKNEPSTVMLPMLEPEASDVLSPLPPAPPLPPTFEEDVFANENNDYWDSWSEMKSFEQNMRQMFQDEKEAKVLNFDPSATHVDVKVEDKKDRFDVTVKTKDIDLSSITIQVNNKKFLKISGMKQESFERKDASTGATMKGEEVRHFIEGIFLPEAVDAKKVKMAMEKDALKIMLPKIKK